jgi:hypothetical protein
MREILHYTRPLTEQVIVDRLSAGPVARITMNGAALREFLPPSERSYNSYSHIAADRTAIGYQRGSTALRVRDLGHVPIDVNHDVPDGEVWIEVEVAS